VHEPTIYQRLGGASGIDAVVRTLHERVRADPDVADLVDPRVRAAADARLLASALGGPGAIDEPDDALLADLVMTETHLRDALWLLGVSTALAAEVVSAVSAETRRLGQQPATGSTTPGGVSR